MKRIKCLSALLTLALLFCMGTANAQSKTISAGQQVEKAQTIERKAAPNARKGPATTTQKKATNKASALESKKVISQQTLKAASMPNRAKAGNANSTNAKKSLGTATLATPGLVTERPISLSGPKSIERSTSNHVNTRVSKTPQKSAPKSAQRID